MEQKIRDGKAIEADYCTGVKFMRQIASERTIFHIAIKKPADRQGGVRNKPLEMKHGKESILREFTAAPLNLTLLIKLTLQPDLERQRDTA